MAIFGNIETLKKQVDAKKFAKAFDYLEKCLKNGTAENIRLMGYELDVFEKIELDIDNFSLEQTYMSKDRDNCFFESHKQYIDVQFIVDGEEIIEVDNISNMTANFQYDSNMDLIKYNDSSFASQIKLQKGDVGIFFPEDAHMPCVKVMESKKVIKTVVKVKV